MSLALDRSEPRAATAVASSASEQAYRILHFGFTVAPLLAGADKFLHVLTNWNQYLAPWIANLLPLSPDAFMRVVGVVEMGAGLLVWFRPRWGAYVVAAWLAGILVNLLTIPGFFDVALRDLGLALGALALGRLASVHDR